MVVFISFLNFALNIRWTNNKRNRVTNLIHIRHNKQMTDTYTLSNVSTREEGISSNAGNTSCIIPEAKNSQTGVSVKYAYDPAKSWYVFRASYGRENQASDFLLEDGSYVYIAKRYTFKEINGKQKKVLEALIPNLLFVYTTKEKAEQYIKHTPELSFLSYYYNHFEQDGNKKNPPLIIPCKQMENFILATCNNNEHLMFVNENQCHYKGGETVRVIDGIFKGVEGKVARVAGQQRIILSLSKVGLISTAYVPSAFIQIIDQSIYP